MNPSAKEYLDKILEKGPESLNEPEKAFLRARRSYLKPSQVEEYKEVLNPVKEVKVEVKPEEAKTEVLVSSESDDALKAFREEATKLEVEFDENTTKDELIQLIKDKKAK
jgi:hypothetical protein